MGWQVERGQNLIKAQNGTWYIGGDKRGNSKSFPITTPQLSHSVTQCHTVSHSGTVCHRPGWFMVFWRHMTIAVVEDWNDSLLEGGRFQDFNHRLFILLDCIQKYSFWHCKTNFKARHYIKHHSCESPRYYWHFSAQLISVTTGGGVLFQASADFFPRWTQLFWGRFIQRISHIFLMKIPDTPFNCISWIINTPAQIPDTKYAVKKMGQSKQQVRQPKHPVLYNIDLHCLLSMSQI